MAGHTLEYLYASFSFLSASVTDSGGEEFRNRLKLFLSVTSSFSNITPFSSAPPLNHRKGLTYSLRMFSVSYCLSLST